MKGVPVLKHGKRLNNGTHKPLFWLLYVVPGADEKAVGLREERKALSSRHSQLGQLYNYFSLLSLKASFRFFSYSNIFVSNNFHGLKVNQSAVSQKA